MGSGPSVIQEKLTFDSPNIEAENEEQERVIVRHEAPEVQDITCFTKATFAISPSDKFIIQIQGAGVLRIGITDKDPKIYSDFYKDTLFEYEEGFSSGDSSRCLFFNDVMQIFCYGPETDYMEYSSNKAEDIRCEKVYLYLMFIYGKPHVSAKYKEKAIEWTHYDDANIRTVDDHTVSLKDVKNTSVMRLNDKMDLNHGYHIHWNMMLSNEHIGGKSPKFGFLRIGLLTENIRDLQKISINSTENIDKAKGWFTESAVAEYPYSGTIAINLISPGVQHNLMVESVGNTKQESLNLAAKHIHLYLEASSGEFAVVRSAHFVALQRLGSAFLVRDFEEFDDHHAARFYIFSTVGHDPYRIQYGPNPRAFIVMFNRLFTTSDLTKFKSTFKQSDSLTDTDSVQIHCMDGVLDQHKIKESFSRRRETGGSEIRKIEQVPELKRCWVIQYQDTAVAKKVWMRQTLKIDNITVHIYPWYPKLGPAVNQGAKPVFDDTDLLLDDLDEEKLRYVMDRDKEKTKLENNINMHVPVSFQWPTTDDFEQENTDNLSLTIKFLPADCSHTVRAFWKSIVREKIELHFTDTICRKHLKVEEKDFDGIIRKLQELPRTKASQFAYIPVKQNLTIQVIFSDNSVLGMLREMVDATSKTEARISLTLPYQVFESYMALDEEGILNVVQDEAPNTRFMITREGNVKITGPKSEVERSKTTIMEFSIQTTEIQKHLTVGQEKVLKTVEGRKCLQTKLKKEKLSSHFKVDESFCKLWVHYKNQEDVDMKEQLLSKLVCSLIYEKKIKITKQKQNIFERNPLDNFLKQFTVSVHIELDLEKEELKISGTENCVKQAEAHIYDYLNERPVVTTTIALPFDVMEYMDSFSDTFKNKHLRILRHNHDAGIGSPVKVQVKATENEIIKLRDSLLQEAIMIKTHWFHVSRPWLAVEGRAVMMDLIKTMTRDNKCIIAPDTTDSLITDNVGYFAIQQIVGVACFSACCDIAKRVVDVTVVPVNDGSLQLNSGPLKAVADEGGRKFTDECNKYVNDHGQLTLLEPVLLGSGNLPCQAVVLIHLPKSDDASNTNLTNALFSTLMIVQNNNFRSVLIPVMKFCLKAGIDKSLDEVMKTIDAFVNKSSGGCLKEIGLCDMRVDNVEKIQKSMSTNLKKPWFVFAHGKALKGINKDMPVGGMPSRERSTSDINMKDTLRWGRNFPRQVQNEDNENDNEIPRRVQSEDFSRGLPFKIELSDLTALHIKKGLIEEMDCEVTVNPTPKFPKLAGAVSKALIKAGGHGILDECQRYGEITHGKVIRTKAGNLNCTHLYHVLQPKDWNPDTGFQVVYEIVIKCLKTAHENKADSIVFPAIGAGASNFPADKVAEAMIKAIFDFVDEVPGTKVKHIVIVLFYKDVDTVKVFENTVPKLISESTEGDIEREQDDQQDIRDAVQDRHLKKFLFIPSKRPNASTPGDDILFLKLTTKGDVKTAVKNFEKLVDDRFVKCEMKYDLEENLTNNEIRLTKNLETVYKVRVTIDLKKSTVTLEGMRDHVKDAEFKLTALFKLEFPSERNYKKMRENVMKSVQWFYVKDDKLEPYDDVSNFDIHFAYLEQQDFVYHNFKEDRKYKVYIATLEEHPVSDTSKRRNMIQRQKISQVFTLPEDWTIYSLNQQDRAEVTLPPSSSEYNDVKQKFLRDGCKPNSIVNIKRIEDRYKFLQYMSKKKQLENQNPPNTKNERHLWHGTDSNTFGKIIKNGFDRNFAGKNATLYGNGVYFALQSGYSDKYAVRDGTGIGRMFLCQVLVGEFCQGYNGLFVLPEKKTVNNVKICFDSAVDKVDKPRIFVIFHDTQAYPQYLIEYT